nr:hypothetical protein [Tanacetum cinerariifolium]
MEHCFDKWSRAEKNSPAENNIHFIAATTQANGRFHPMLEVDSQLMSSLMHLKDVHQQSSRMSKDLELQMVRANECENWFNTDQDN